MKSSDKKTPKGFWRENVEALTFAIIMALVIKQFAFEAYKVPTQSMEPTIIGRDVGGSRLIANKFSYMINDPKRWDVMIFNYPHNRLLNYVKRGVGVGPEWLFVRGGDLYVADYDMSQEEALKNAKILRKPESLQERIFDANNCIAPDKRSIENFRSYWANEKGANAEGVSPDFNEELIHIDGTKEAVRLRFTRPGQELSVVGKKENAICNRRFDDWSTRAPKTGTFSKLLGLPFPVDNESFAPAVPVGDMRMRFEVKPLTASGKVLFEIRDFSHTLAITVSIAVEGAQEKGFLTVGKETKEISQRIPVDSWTEVSVSNCDNRVSVRVDGETAIELDYDHQIVPVTRAILSNSQTTPLPEDAPQAQKVPKANENAMIWGFEGGKADFQNLELSRDNYYTESGATDFHIPADNYLMLGDNSPDSLDGRNWQVSELKYKDENGKIITLIGDSEAVNESPERPQENPFENNTKFLDVFGNLHDIDPDRIIMVPGVKVDGIREMHAATIRLGNFVPRKYIQGRAYLTFFPLLQIGPIR